MPQKKPPFPYMQRFRVELKFHYMLSGRHIHCPKNIIRSSVRRFHTINICLPTGIVNFRENHCSSSFGINLIFQVIRFVRSQFDCTQCICFSCRFYLRTEFFIYDSRFCRVYPMQSVYLFIGIVTYCTSFTNQALPSV